MGATLAYFTGAGRGRADSRSWKNEGLAGPVGLNSEAYSANGQPAPAAGAIRFAVAPYGLRQAIYPPYVFYSFTAPVIAAT